MAALNLNGAGATAARTASTAPGATNLYGQTPQGILTSQGGIDPGTGAPAQWNAYQSGLPSQPAPAAPSEAPASFGAAPPSGYGGGQTNEQSYLQYAQGQEQNFGGGATPGVGQAPAGYSTGLEQQALANRQAENRAAGINSGALPGVQEALAQSRTNPTAGEGQGGGLYLKLSQALATGELPEGMTQEDVVAKMNSIKGQS